MPKSCPKENSDSIQKWIASPLPHRFSWICKNTNECKIGCFQNVRPTNVLFRASQSNIRRFSVWSKQRCLPINHQRQSAPKRRSNRNCFGGQCAARRLCRSPYLSCKKNLLLILSDITQRPSVFSPALQLHRGKLALHFPQTLLQKAQRRPTLPLPAFCLSSHPHRGGSGRLILSWIVKNPPEKRRAVDPGSNLSHFGETLSCWPPHTRCDSQF